MTYNIIFVISNSQIAFLDLNHDFLSFDFKSYPTLALANLRDPEVDVPTDTYSVQLAMLKINTKGPKWRTRAICTYRMEPTSNGKDIKLIFCGGLFLKINVR